MLLVKKNKKTAKVQFDYSANDIDPDLQNFQIFQFHPVKIRAPTKTTVPILSQTLII